LFLVSPKQIFRILIASVFLGCMEVITISSLLPIIKMVTDEEMSRDSLIIRLLLRLFDLLGVTSNLINHIFFFLVASFLTSLFFMVVAYDRGSFIRNRELHIKGTLLKSILDSKWEVLCRHHHGHLVNGLTRESDLSKIACDYLLNSTTNLIFITSFLASLFFLDPWLTLICLGVYLSTYVVIGPVLNYSKKLGKIFSLESSHYSQAILNMCRSLKNIKAMSLENQIQDYVGSSIHKVARAYFLNNGIVAAFRNRFFEFLGMLSLCSLIYFAMEILKTERSNMLLMLSVLIKITPVASNTFNQLALILSNYPSIEYVNELNQKSVPDEPGTIALEDQQRVLTMHFNQVSFAYAEKTVLRDFSYTFEKGKFYKVVGESGGGKTTLLDLASGLISPQKGSITIDSNPLLSIHKLHRSQRIGYLSQNSFLFEGSLKSNVLWGYVDEVDEQKLLQSIQMAGLEDFVRENGLDYEITESGQNLSGGQKQRVALTRLFLGDYDFLLLDEPTSALDGETEAHVMEQLRRMKKQVGIICITHRAFDQEGDIDHVIEATSFSNS